jgi:Sulfotransferase family
MAGPVFIVGAMGSGTTLLRLVLDSHENIAIPRETGFMRGYDAHRFTPFKWSGGNWAKRLGWSDEELDAIMRELYERLFTRYAERHGKHRWGEKTPLHTWHVEDMARLFPDAQFVGVVRHPAASVASNMARFNRMGLAKAQRHWNRYSGELARQAALQGDRFALIRYEDLVLQPEPLLRALLDWLGEPWSDAVLRHHAVLPGREGKARAVEGWSRTDEPIDPARVARWTTTMRDEHRDWLAERMARRADFFGYSMEAAEPVAAIAQSGSTVVLGAEIDARIAAYPDLDLRAKGRAPIYDGFYDPREVMMLRNDQYARLTERRGLRGVGVALARRLAPERRERVQKAVRRTRAKLGLRRRPPTV